MAKYLNSTGVTLLWNKFKTLLAGKANVTDLSNVIYDNVVTDNNFEDIDNIIIDTELNANSNNLITNSVVTNAINSKLDKEVWDERNEQFGRSGWYNKTTGTRYDDISYKSSDILPLNRQFDIVYYGYAHGNAASIVFFAADKSFISAIQYTGEASEHFLSKSEFPESAVYVVFTVYANAANCFYSNGTTVESREGATAEAIERSKKVLFVDLWTNLSTPVLKYKYYPETDTFGAECSTDLNEEITIEGSKYILKDMTYEQALYAYLRRTNVVLPTACIKGRMNIIPNGYQYGSGPTFNILGSAQAVYENTNEVIILSAPAINCVTDKNLTINNCNNTKAIIGKIRCSVENNPIKFDYIDTAVPMLEYMTPKIKVNFDIRWFSKLTLFTMKYIVNNAENTSPITITVHPDVYAKLTDDEVTEYVPANLLLDSDTEANYINASRFIYFGDIKPKAGDKVTITVWGDFPNELQKLNIYNSGSQGHNLEGGITKKSDGIYSASLTWGDKGNNTYIYLVSTPSLTDFGVYTMNKIKFEFGENANPAWTPAIEEIEDEELKEKAQWAALVGQAAAKQITFVNGGVATTSLVQDVQAEEINETI